MDKLVSLVNYSLSSAEKVIKYVTITNFEAEFAIKLFRSDRDTLLSELDTFVPLISLRTRRSSVESWGPVTRLRGDCRRAPTCPARTTP